MHFWDKLVQYEIISIYDITNMSLQVSPLLQIQSDTSITQFMCQLKCDNSGYSQITMCSWNTLEREAGILDLDLVSHKLHTAPEYIG